MNRRLGAIAGFCCFLFSCCIIPFARLWQWITPLIPLPSDGGEIWLYPALETMGVFYSRYAWPDSNPDASFPFPKHMPWVGGGNSHANRPGFKKGRKRRIP